MGEGCKSAYGRAGVSLEAGEKVLGLVCEAVRATHSQRVLVVSEDEAAEVEAACPEPSYAVSVVTEGEGVAFV